ncbi:uncharacterized protein LOC110838701 [Zootermopsis nevadensis]|uniref:Uncharacterized protein n=1 Tax=Zootermopsis nevadensis TaxID=136037 RepID=A0A067QKR4_ZOONE|nr:uncharacterized protein LOC110838701 [Zootermopsis nevadensis]XP_021937859.1 uncharacterized protein LOC110838701 [Zootermopsis nevadensis]XP_021937860.1 uncharacterized protein LOC110838701 [Zootermopsis nevadensis]XP_021937862.1 uncharacterized protein LOC110838701 [Zootermopsis nevadensis]XP_021937863.1 uncharacterized protein LOC110838701 [Zootermopsis nevadensis]XP_021937864.1 uncharacterized protein LOC110838701 [Zootermopsis nevadensis]XP_021937865.1 uncharacterized protein LOC11083
MKRLPMREEHYSKSLRNAEVFNKQVKRNKGAKTRKPMLDAEDICTPKRSKTVNLTSARFVFTEDCASTKPNRLSNCKWRKSANVINTKNQFGLLRDCQVKLERLSSEVLSRALSGEKVLKNAKMRPVTRMHYRYNCDSSSFFQKSVGKDCGTKQEIQGSLRLSEEGGDCNAQNCDNACKSDKIDSWGNVRCPLEGSCDFSESEEDWCGWWVRVDSLHDFYNADLYTISDGVTESRIIIWDNAFKAEVTSNNNSVQIPKQIGCVNKEIQEDTEEEWAGWNVLYVKRNISNMSSVNFSEEETDVQ